MTTTIAGLKRSYHEMNDTALASRYLDSSSVPPTQSPSGISSRDSSLPRDDRGYEKVESSKLLPRIASFEPSISIVLIGVRGVGKSTLGILAATEYSRRLVDTERAFQDATGIAASEFRKSNGTAEYRKRHGQIFESTLKGNSSGAVIVCNFSDLEGNGSRILRDYAQSHPVIHITRDVGGVKAQLRIWTTERVNELLSASKPLLHSCSNYEFYNLTESHYGPEPHKDIDQNAAVAANENFLTLKRVERDFLKLLQNIVGDFERGQSHHSAYPFSQVAVERRKYTFAVAITTSDILEDSVDFDNAQIGADCVELVVNHSSTSKRRYFSDTAKAFAIVRRATILPIMISVEKGQSLVMSASASETSEYCLRLAPELCVVDLSLTESQLLSIARSKGNSRMIGRLEMDSMPQQGWKDQACIETYSRAARVGCDIVKITMPAVSVDDGFDIQALQIQIEALKLRPPLIAYNTGSKGRTSKCFNKTLTAVRPSYTLSQLANTERPTDVSAQDISRALFGSFVFESLRFFIYGADVSYSLSPAMHNVAYDACGMRYTYEAMSSDSIDDLKEVVMKNDFGGTAITQPYKTSALELMNGLSPHAMAIGAVNTIIPIRELSADGQIPDEINIISRRTQQGPVKALYGFNTGIVHATWVFILEHTWLTDVWTDWIGIRACIRRGLSPANTIRPNTSALVCGAGGMARSAVYSMISLGVRHIYVCNRTFSRAEALAKNYNDQIVNEQMSVLSSVNGSQTRVHALESIESSWPADVRVPTVIVSCIPRRTSDNAAINFTLPEAWLKSPTGGVVLEASQQVLHRWRVHKTLARMQRFKHIV